jgi:hypothetical protein
MGFCIKQNIKYSFQTSSTFVFLFFSPTRIVALKVDLPSTIYQHTKLHGPTLTGATFAFTSEVERPPFWRSWQYGIKNYSIEVISNVMASLLNFIKIH